MKRLVDVAGTENRYSQFGEDAVTALALEILGVEHGFVVEFGAGDGLELSNTAQFWRDRRWPALLIEPDPIRYDGLKANTRGFDVSITDMAIEPTGRATIDTLVADQEIELMSIDVDDCEYQIFEAMQARPKLVLIEFNYTMPHHLDMVGAPGSRLQASPLALVRLAHRKGYSLLAITGCNCLFVRDDHLEPFQQFDRDYDNLVDPAASTYVVTDWMGRYFFVGPQPHGMTEVYVDPPVRTASS